jgi:hypothetical protein
VAFGLLDRGIPFGDNAFVLAMLSKAADAICDDTHRLIAGISENKQRLGTQQPCCFFDGLLTLFVPCRLLSGSDSPEADEVLLRQD